MKSQNMIIALAQFAPVWKAVEENLAQMLDMIDEAGKAGANLLVFPELCRTGYFPKPAIEESNIMAETLPSPDSGRIAEAASRYKMSVVYGTLERSPAGAYNTVVWLEQDKLFRYRKTHIHWTENFTPGTDLPVFRSGLVSAGALVCFDLGFPEAARTLALNSAELIVAPSAVPRTFKDINRRRVVARAMDNQLFVLYCNYTGKGYEGGSIVADPSGEIMLETGTEPGVFVQTIDLGRVAHWRNDERIFKHRRPEIYTI